jgi:hypothetical protein
MDMVLVWRSRDRHIHSVFFRETWRKHMSRGAPNLVCSKSFRGSHLNVEKTHARKKLCENGKCPYFFTCLRFETPGFSVVPSSGRPASQAKWHTPKTKTANPISRRHVEIIHSDLDGSQAKGFLRCVGTILGDFLYLGSYNRRQRPFFGHFSIKSQCATFVAARFTND